MQRTEKVRAFCILKQSVLCLQGADEVEEADDSFEGVLKKRSAAEVAEGGLGSNSGEEEEVQDAGEQRKAKKKKTNKSKNGSEGPPLSNVGVHYWFALWIVAVFLLGTSHTHTNPKPAHVSAG